ncbi:hypothetical protein QJQ45_010989 [Haematococcus lacustris]|nr:hypothetical protein QJQ45_010989 [Haematococcus lacustris]
MQRVDVCGCNKGMEISVGEQLGGCDQQQQQQHALPQYDLRTSLGKDVVALHSMMQQTEEALRHAILEECVPRGELQQLEERLDEKLAIKEEVILRFAPAGSAGWVEIHVEGEAASYRSGQSLLAISKVTAQMAEVIAACNNLVPSQVPLAHRSCARAAAAAFAVGKRLRGKEPASQLQPMARLCSTPTQAPAQPGPAHAPCPHHLPVQPPSHPSQSQLQGSSQHHPALPALLHLPGLSILTRPATNPLTSPAEEHQPMIHTTVQQDEQTMPPSMPKQQQDWATARAIASEVLQQIQQVPALLRLLRSQPDSKVALQLSTLQDAEAQLGRLEFALQHIMQPR